MNTTIQTVGKWIKATAGFDLTESALRTRVEHAQADRTKGRDGPDCRPGRLGCAVRWEVPDRKVCALLTQRMAGALSAPMREGLDALVAVDDDQPHSPLNRVKANSSVRGMKRLLVRLELSEATYVLGVDVGWGKQQLPADPSSSRATPAGC